VSPELRVVADVAEEAAKHFLELQPRSVALAGGNTPRALYERLRGCDYAWSGVDVFFGDERCVPRTHADSNFRMASEALLAHVQARVHPMDGVACDPAREEAELAAVFGPGLPRFDLVLLGLGADGHTASLFPGDPALEAGERYVVKVERDAHARLSLTLPVLSAAKAAIFLVTGETKRDALAQLLRGGDIPAARIACERIVVIADHAAAGDRGAPKP